MSISKMSSSANQPVLRRADALDEVAAAVEEREPGGAEQVLDRAGGEEVDPERAHVDRDNAGGLVGVEEDERPALVGGSTTPSHVD